MEPPLPFLDVCKRNFKNLRDSLRWLAPRAVLIGAGYACLKLTWDSVQNYPFSRDVIAIVVPLGIVAMTALDLRKKRGQRATLISAAGILAEKTTFVATSIAFLGLVYAATSFIAIREARVAQRHNDANTYFTLQLLGAYYGNQGELFQAQKLERGVFGGAEPIDCSRDAELSRWRFIGSQTLDDVDKDQLILAEEGCARIRHDSIAVAYFDEERHAFRFAPGGSDPMTEFEEALFTERDVPAAEMVATQAWFRDPERLLRALSGGYPHSPIHFLLIDALMAKRALCGGTMHGSRLLIPESCLREVRR